MSRPESADVYREGQKVGRIERTRKGSVFEYDTDFVRNISRTAPKEIGIATHLPYAKRRVETVGVNLHTFFAGLLPEGLRLRAVASRIKTSEDDLLSLLVAIGGECIGDVYVSPEGKAPASPAPVADLTKLDQVVFADLFRESISGGVSARIEGFSIPGVQEKVSAAMARKARRAYILKLNPEDRPRLVENEYFFLKMAKACGLRVTEATLVRDQEGKAGLLVERFDRYYDSTKKRMKRIHQEDACQILDRYPADKYRIKFSEIAERLSICPAPVLEVAKLIRLKAFSYLIGNGDLHAKNVSVYKPPKTGRMELTPAYDLLSTIPYGDSKMALSFEGRDDNLTREDFVRFGERYGVKGAATRALLDQLYEASEAWLDRLGEIGLAERKAEHLRKTMKFRREQIRGARLARL